MGLFGCRIDGSEKKKNLRNSVLERTSEKPTLLAQSVRQACTLGTISPERLEAWLWGLSDSTSMFMGERGPPLPNGLTAGDQRCSCNSFIIAEGLSGVIKMIMMEVHFIMTNDYPPWCGAAVMGRGLPIGCLDSDANIFEAPKDDSPSWEIPCNWISKFQSSVCTSWLSVSNRKPRRWFEIRACLRGSSHDIPNLLLFDEGQGNPLWNSSGSHRVWLKIDSVWLQNFKSLSMRVLIARVKASQIQSGRRILHHYGINGANWNKFLWLVSICLSFFVDPNAKWFWLFLGGYLKNDSAPETLFIPRIFELVASTAHDFHTVTIFTKAQDRTRTSEYHAQEGHSSSQKIFEILAEKNKEKKEKCLKKKHTNILQRNCSGGGLFNALVYFSQSIFGCFSKCGSSPESNPTTW